MESSHPVDKGWAWACVLGGFVNFFCVTGSSRASGILFVEIEKTFPGSSSLSAVMFGLQMGSLALTSVLYPLLSRKISDRQMAMFGGVCLALSYSLLSLATDLYYVVLVFGFLNGIGFALIFNPCNVVLGQYFSRRLSLASGLMFAGDSLGMLVMPLLLFPILQEYALRGTLLIWGGVIFHTVAASALFRPVSFYELTSPGKLETPSMETKNVRQSESPNVDHNSTGTASEKAHVVDTTSSVLTNKDDTVVSNLGHVQSTPLNTKSETEVTRTEDPPNGVESGETMDVLYKTTECSRDKVTIDGKSSSDTPKGCCAANIVMWKLFLNPAFVLYWAGATVAMCGYFDLFLFVPSHAAEFHVSPFNISLLITVSGAVDLVTKVTVGWFATLNLIRRSTIIGVLLVFTSAVVSPCVSARSYPTEMTYVLFVAVVGGAFVALNPVALRDITGNTNFRSAMAVSVASVGITNLWLPSLFGVIKDANDSYAVSLHMCGGLMSLGGALVLLSSLVDRRRHLVSAV